MTKYLIDCDPGHDDAIAILYAARHLDIAGITTVFGNQTVERTTYNALRVLTLARLDIPVARGCGRPLLGEAPLAADGHGKTGLDGVDLPEPDREPVVLDAVHFIIETARQHRGALHLVVIGAQTNVALALRLEPRLAEWLAGISIMGGTAGIGSLKPMGCVNVLSDPEAAHIVFSSGVPIRWIGYDTTRTVLMTEADIARLRAGGAVAQRMGDIAAWYRERQIALYGLDGAPMHDSCAVAPFIRPELIRYEPVPLAVVTAPGIARGMTIVDRRPLRPDLALTSIEPKAPANVEMAVEIDRRALIDDIVATLLTY